MALHLLLLLVSLAQTSEAEYQASELELKLADLESSYIVSEVLKSRPPESENLKCPLTKLHQDIETFSRADYQPLPRLADLKAKYPGERFSRLKGSWCVNVSSRYLIITNHLFIFTIFQRYPFCEGLAADSSCNGTNIKVTDWL